MKKQLSFIHHHIVQNIISEFERVYKSFNEEAFEDVMLDKISRLRTDEIIEVVGVTIDQARKYKSGYSLPSLKGAVLIEEAFSIPAGFWVKYQKAMQLQKAQPKNKVVT